MPDYRLFDLKPDGEVVLPGEDFFATSDEVAITYAGGRLGVHGCELWSRDRFVALIPSPAAQGTVGEEQTAPRPR